MDILTDFEEYRKEFLDARNLYDESHCLFDRAIRSEKEGVHDSATQYYGHVFLIASNACVRFELLKGRVNKKICSLDYESDEFRNLAWLNAKLKSDYIKPLVSMIRSAERYLKEHDSGFDELRNDESFIKFRAVSDPCP